jgi:heptosyltransferase-2
LASPRSILIYSPSWIGDAVMSLGAVRSLRAAYRDAHIAVLTRPAVQDLYSGCEAVDEALVYDRDGDHRGPRGFFRMARALRDRRFESAILFPNAFRAAALIFAAGVPERCGYATDGRGFLLTRPVAPQPRPFGRHQVHYYLDLLRLLGIPAGPPDTRLTVTKAARERALLLLADEGHVAGEPLVGIHPGATNGSAKRWLPERFAGVVERLAEAHRARVVVLGGSEERDLAREVAHHLTRPPFLLAGRTSLAELMGVLQSLSVLVANDSGPMHVAAALGVPTVAVFGPSDERETAPAGPSTRTVRQRVDCSPCLFKECPIDHRCMTRVEESAVYQAAMELWPAPGGVGVSAPPS